MIISVSLHCAHMTNQQMGALVAHCYKQEHFHSIEVAKEGHAEVRFELLTEVIHFAKMQEQLQAEMEVLSKLDPLPCVCGCGAFIAISPCYRQSGEAMIGKLTSEEFATARSGRKIEAIKMVRERLKNSNRPYDLKLAKDMVDQSGAYTYPEPLKIY